MNILLVVSLLLLGAFYVMSLSFSTGMAFILFFLSLAAMVGAIYQESAKEKKGTHLRLVK